MNEQPQIRNPSITLYPFHLRNDGNEGYQQTAQNAELLWKNLAENVGEKFDLPELKSLRDKLICYQNGLYHPAGENDGFSDQKLLIPNGKTLKFEPITQPENRKLYGSIDARRIHDTYTADLTFYYKDDTIQVADLKQFNPQCCLLPNQIQASLGQTLLLYAEPIVYNGPHTCR